jgi:hypothetical protein
MHRARSLGAVLRPAVVPGCQYGDSWFPEFIAYVCECSGAVDASHLLSATGACVRMTSDHDRKACDWQKNTRGNMYYHFVLLLFVDVVLSQLRVMLLMMIQERCPAVMMARSFSRALWGISHCCPK